LSNPAEAWIAQCIAHQNDPRAEQMATQVFQTPIKWWPKGATVPTPPQIPDAWVVLVANDWWQRHLAAEIYALLNDRSWVRQIPAFRRAHPYTKPINAAIMFVVICALAEVLARRQNEMTETISGLAASAGTGEQDSFNI